MGINPTGRELDILKILWQQKRATVREVWQQLTGPDKELAYTTVLSLFQTMEKKGLVEHESSGKAYRYSAKVHRKETIGELASQFLERVFDGAMDEYLAHALQSRPVSEQELNQLGAMIEEAKKRRGRRRERS